MRRSSKVDRMMTPKRRLYIWEYISKSSSASPTVKPEQLANVLTIEKCCSHSSICFAAACLAFETSSSSAACELCLQL